MDGDDISLPTRFQEMKRELDQHPTAAVVNCQHSLIDENGFPISLACEKYEFTTMAVRKKVLISFFLENPISRVQQVVLKPDADSVFQSWLTLLYDSVQLQKCLYFYRKYSKNFVKN